MKKMNKKVLIVFLWPMKEMLDVMLSKNIYVQTLSNLQFVRPVNNSFQITTHQKEEHGTKRSKPNDTVADLSNKSERRR